jgi:hypothetical protein
MSTIRETLISRFKWDHVPALASVKREVERALDTSDKIRDEHRKISRDEKLTRLGQQEALRGAIARDIASNLYAGRRALALMQEQIDRRRASLTPKSPDKQDVAGAVARADLRAMLRSMPAGQRNLLVLAHDADPILQSAVLELPNYASGISDEARDLITKAVIEREHPGALSTIEQMEDCSVLLKAAVDYTINLAATAAEFHNSAMFDHFVDEAVGEKATAINASVEQYFRPLTEAA